jgi:LmbE family N-acetylglucosaminyl deacetylase
VLRLALPQDRPLRIAAIGAHPDDIEIGCGGTILRLVNGGGVEHATWAVLSGEAERRTEAERAAAAFADGVGDIDLRLGSFRDGYFPAEYGAVKEFLHDLAPAAPDLVFVPGRMDAHQDHRLLGELAWTVFRDAMILEYEIPKYDGDLLTPTMYVDVPVATVDRKIGLLLDLFPSQRGRSWFDADAFRAILRLRGVEAKSDSGFAEGFTARKVAL